MNWAKDKRRQQTRQAHRDAYDEEKLLLVEKGPWFDTDCTDGPPKHLPRDLLASIARLKALADYDIRQKRIPEVMVLSRWCFSQLRSILRGRSLETLSAGKQPQVIGSGLHEYVFWLTPRLKLLVVHHERMDNGRVHLMTLADWQAMGKP